MSGRLASAAAVRAAVAELADVQRARDRARFFGARPGGDGEGDSFAGLTVPQQRAVARRARDLPLAEVEALLASPVHEHRFIALAILVARVRREPAQRPALARCYLDRRERANHWDLVDVSAPDLLAGAGDATLDALIASPSHWDRRISLLATFARIRRGDLDATYRLCERVLGDRHHLVHKAAGWMLREAGKRDEERLVAWLRAHAGGMPRTMLRYAVERLDGPLRMELLGAPR